MPPETPDVRVGVDLVVHAGDLGDPSILERLAAPAPAVVETRVEGGRP